MTRVAVRWRRRPFLWASWAPWPLKVMVLGVMPTVFLADFTLMMARPNWLTLLSTALLAGSWLAGVDLQHDSWRLDQEIQRRRRER